MVMLWSNIKEIYFIWVLIQVDWKVSFNKINEESYWFLNYDIINYILSCFYLLWKRLPLQSNFTTEITKLNGSVCEGNEPSRLCQKSEC